MFRISLQCSIIQRKMLKSFDKCWVVGSQYIWWVQTWLGYHIWTLRTHSKDSQIHLFFHFSHDMSYISPFFLMSNEIILLQILYKPLKYLLFSLMKVRIIKVYPMWAMFCQCPKNPKIWVSKTFYIMIRHLALVTFIHFIHISTWRFCDKNLKWKKVWTFFMS
jgi:hypothetical protein